MPRKPLTCLKMAVSSLFMRRGGRDCGTRIQCSIEQPGNKDGPETGAAWRPQKRGRGIISNSKAFPYCGPKNGSGFMIFNFFWDVYKIFLLLTLNGLKLLSKSKPQSLGRRTPSFAPGRFLDRANPARCLRKELCKRRQSDANFIGSLSRNEVQGLTANLFP